MWNKLSNAFRNYFKDRGFSFYTKLITGGGPVLGAILNPLLLHMRYKDSDIPVERRKLLVYQEIANQTVTAIFHLITFFGAATLFTKLVGNRGWSAKKLEDFGVMAANLGGLVGATLIRPFVGSLILLRVNQMLGLKEKEGKGVDVTSPTLRPSIESAFQKTGWSGNPIPPPTVHTSPGGPLGMRL